MDSNQAENGQTLQGTVAESVIVNDAVAIPKGAAALAKVDDVKRSGRFRGSSEIRLKLVQITVGSRDYTLEASYDITNKRIGHIVSKGKGVAIEPGSPIDFSLAQPLTVRAR